MLGSTAYAYVNSQSFSVSKTSVSNGDSRFVFDFDLSGISGKFYPCIQFVGDSRFEIGDYKKGIDTERKKDILLRRLTSKVVCDECSLKDRCIYKCGCARIMTTNDIVEVSPIVCETERIYIEMADNLANKLYRDFKDEFILLNYRK